MNLSKYGFRKDFIEEVLKNKHLSDGTIRKKINKVLDKYDPLIKNYSDSDWEAELRSEVHKKEVIIEVLKTNKIRYENGFIYLSDVSSIKKSTKKIGYGESDEEFILVTTKSGKETHLSPYFDFLLEI